MARRVKKAELTPELMAQLEEIGELLFRAGELLEKTDEVEGREYTDLYVPLLNIVHRRIPDTFLLYQLLMDANDSEMRCPK